MLESAWVSDFWDYTGHLALCLVYINLIILAWSLIVFIFDKIRGLFNQPAVQVPVHEFVVQKPAREFVKSVDNSHKMLRYFILKMKCEQWPYLDKYHYNLELTREWDLINYGKKRVYVFEDIDDVAGGIFQCYVKLGEQKRGFWYIEEYALDWCGGNLQKFRVLIDTVEVGFLKETLYVELNKHDRGEIAFFEQCGFSLMKSPPHKPKGIDQVVYYRPTTWMHEEFA